MPFESTPVRTNFTGANEDPLSEGGNWAGPTRNGGRQCERNTNAAAHSNNPNASAAATSYWAAAQFGGNCESYATMSVVPTTNGRGLSVWARIHNPGNATTMEAYLGVWTLATGWRLFKVTSGATFTQIGSTTTTPNPADGDKIGLEVIGSSLTLYHFTGGAWVSRVTGTDTAITGAGYIGIEFSTSETAARFDDFGGGTIVSSIFPNRNQSILLRR